MSGDLHQYVDKMEEKYYNVSLAAQGMYPQDLDILRMNSKVELMTSKAVALPVLIPSELSENIKNACNKTINAHCFYSFLFEFWENKT